jgi:hypothetical protein
VTLETKIRKLREESVAAGKSAVPDTLQGVGKQRIAAVLHSLHRYTPDIVDAVFALLDTRISWFTTADWAQFCDGATTAHIGCHVGVLQRGENKLDREGRDYWIKPLRELGAIEPVFLHPQLKRFIPGHPIAKSGNSAYRLAEGFLAVLKAPDDRRDVLLAEWVKADRVRERAEFQAKLAEESRKLVDTKHADLINMSVERYAPRFLPGYKVVYVDDGDGDRIDEDDRMRLEAAGLKLDLGDPMPDVLLWNKQLDSYWVIEAVMSDGEVDSHKVERVLELLKRSGKAKVGFTTTYWTWKDLAARQDRHSNIAPGTLIWIVHDSAKQLFVCTWSENDFIKYGIDTSLVGEDIADLGG